MKILYIKAKNFIGIYSGTGKTEIEIDFTKGNNDITLLLGKNGSGKSSLMSILHPYRETFDNRKNIILENKEGYKEIHLLYKKDIYKIIHHYGKSSSKNKSYISKNGVELNENGNITSFVEILEEKFNLTKDYFIIGKMGSNISGFIGLTTANRKSYMNKFIPNIDEYLDAYEIVNEKYKSHNKDIKTLKNSLNSFNSDQLQIDKSNYETKKLSLIKQNKEYNSALILLENKTSELKESLNEVPENIKELYEKAKEKYDYELLKLNGYKEKYPKLEEYDIQSLEIKINKNENDKIILNNDLENTLNNVIQMNLNKNDIEASINKNNSLKEEAYIDFIKPSEIKVSLFNKKNELSSEILKLNNIEKLLKENKFLDFSKNNNYTIAKSEYEQTINIINSIKSEYDLSLFEETNINEFKNYLNKLNKMKKLYSDTNSLLSDIKYNINTLEKDYKKYKPIYDKIPEGCTNSNCIFIKNAKYFMETEYSKINNLYKEREDLEKLLSSYEKSIEKLVNQVDYINKIKNYILDSLETKEFMKLIISTNNIDDIIRNTAKYEEFCSRNIDFMKDYTVTKELIKNIENNICLTQNILKLNENKEILINNYESELCKLNNELVNIDNTINSDNDKIEKLEKSIKVKTNTNKLFNIFHEILKNYNKYKNEYTEYSNLYNDNLKTLNDIEDNNKKYNAVNNCLRDNENEIKTIENKLENIKNNLFLYETYKNRLDEIENEMNDLELIKDSLDPKKGIPLIFMTNYLNIISASANKLLDIAYDGDFKIAFKVTSKEFLINVFKSDGTILNDISEASQGEIAMTTVALSLAMMDNLLKDCSYNILYLDEIDSTLSSENRRIFLDLINKQMKEANIEQCFAISHNDEFYSKPINMVLFKEANIDKDNEDLMENKCILWEI